MPASRAAISSCSFSTEPSISRMAVSESENDSLSPLCLSSAASKCFAQYAFLLSSSACSRLRVATISSTMETTLSKPACFPSKARAMRLSSGRPEIPSRGAARTAASALARSAAAVSWTCTRLAAEPGRVSRKSSKESSSLRTLIVCERATSSRARSSLTFSQSFALVLHPFCSSARNFASSSSDSCVSSRSFSMPAISTPSFPSRFCSSSIWSVSEATSFSLTCVMPS
mmetsp:Transcript_111145/g.314507  ORF Transcript_111145/g.314507 Transcript_111145/m.314507 type:complete len:229 (-) Transcript_111145:745-1431(-)